MKGQTRRPSQAQLILPLVELVEAQGPIKAKHAAEALAENLGIEPDLQEEVIRTPKGQRVAVWRRHVRFVALKGRTAGLLDLQDGFWRVRSDTGRRLDRSMPTVVVTVAVDEAGRPRKARLDIAAAVPTSHALIWADSRDLSFIPDSSIGLVVTSCPYADLIKYDGGGVGQLGDMTDYDAFLMELDRVWLECARVLMPGARIACVVGDVLRSRREHGRHHILPLAADIMVRSRRFGLDALTPIHWLKPTNVQFEGGGRGRLGKPGLPNQIIQSEQETIVMLRKPGYRSPTAEQIERSRLTPAEEAAWLRQRWEGIPGQRRQKDGHPAPFPVGLVERLVRLFSFERDVVLDPFAGSFSTSIAAMNTNRSSIGVEISERYFQLGLRRIEKAAAQRAAA